ncbi:hypothetical protein EVAR_55147_1 [Eumeta japonica]|uniref:Uncharacterized protein n=1 Tax=Eumeta variegata TaxID=151549 RepID=A0A4C1YAZ0_EUMVA|nr:hypothetical protein EVAR_55147_1 [Eumeta japonica]
MPLSEFENQNTMKSKKKPDKRESNSPIEGSVQICRSDRETVNVTVALASELARSECAFHHETLAVGRPARTEQHDNGSYFGDVIDIYWLRIPRDLKKVQRMAIAFTSDSYTGQVDLSPVIQRPEALGFTEDIRLEARRVRCSYKINNHWKRSVPRRHPKVLEGPPSEPTARVNIGRASSGSRRCLSMAQTAFECFQTKLTG